MGIFDFLNKKEEKKDENKVNPKRGTAEQDTVQDKAAQSSSEQSSPGSGKPLAPKDRAPAPSRKYYEVQEGDSLSRIAKEHYGDASKWKMIYEANQKEIQDPDKIFPGQMIELPDSGKERRG